METYHIFRDYMNGGREVVKRGLTLEQAQAHCRDPETASRTCTKAAGKRRTEKKGPWFEGYNQE